MAAVSWKTAVNGNWTVAADWSAGAVPVAADDATIAVPGAYTVSVTTPITVHSITVSDLGATLAIADVGTTEAVTAGLTNSGTVDVDVSGSGGSGLKIGGTLSNSGLFAVGNGGLGSSGVGGATTVTAAGLANTGTIDLIGSPNGSSGQAAIEIAAAAPATWTGNAVLQGDALFQFASGGIGAIAGNSELALFGAQSRVALSSATTSNSALTGLNSNGGTLILQGGPSIATTGAFANNGAIVVDGDVLGTGDPGGSSVKLGGVLTNQGDLDIGNSGLSTAATVTATGLVNAAIGTISLTGGAAGSAAQASLDITGAAPATLFGSVFLQGNALLEFASGGTTFIAPNTELSLSGAGARVALASNTAASGALTGLATVDGILDLENHASVATATSLKSWGTLEINGGSRLTLGGTLTNIAALEIGDAAQVTTAGLVNSGAIELTGGAGRATLDSTAAAFPTLFGSIDLSGNALLEFASGSITGIARQAELRLDGPRARVALSSDTTASGALSKLASNAGSFVLADGAAVATTVAFMNASELSVDSLFGFGSSFRNDGGSSLTVGGTLTNTASGSLNIGNSGILAATAVTAAGLGNSGTISLLGGMAQATLDITAAAPATLASGTMDLLGNALLEYASGGITAIGTGAGLSLDGAQARVALNTALTTNSALTGLASNAGSFRLADGEALTTTVAFANTGSVGVDASGSGGTRLTLGGALTNGTTASFDIGNGGITAATVVTASGLANSGRITVTGGAASADLAELNITVAAPATLTGSFGLAGNALLAYSSGGIGAIGAGASLSLDGASPRVASSGHTGSSSALTGLANNLGNFSLADGAAVATTTGLTNSGGVDVDTGFFGSGSGSGGSSLTVGGILTNKSSLDIGNTGLAKVATVTATGLVNSGTIDLTGGASQANLKITGAASNTGSIDLSNGLLAITTGLTNSGTVDIDAFGGSGGSLLTIGGTLTNSGFSFDIGNGAITKATTVTAAGLANTGTIDLTGAAAVQATLNIKAAAPATWAGTANLTGDALLEFASGGITAIGNGAGLSLNGAKALVALSTALTSDSALTGLGSNAGTFSLAGGGALTTTVGFTNNQTMEIDTSGGGGSSLTIGGALTNKGFLDIGNSAITAATALAAASLTNTATVELTSGTAQAALKVTGAFGNSANVEVDPFGNGGSLLTIGGTLTNSGFSFDIGNGAITKATTATAAGLANTGTIDLTGAAAVQTTLNIAAAAPATWAGSANLTGDALLEFASGGIGAIGNGASLSLNGAKALVALSTALTSNSALTGLGSNAGTFNLAGGGALTTTVAFTNNQTMEVDASGGGGSSLTIGGALANKGFLDIGNSAITKATILAAASLTNTSTVELTSGTAQAALKVIGAFGNSATVDVDAFGTGGSLLSIGGTLTNSNFIEIGNNAITKATTATAAGLANTGTIALTGAATVQTSLNIAAAAPATLTAGTLNLSGDALLEFASGGITAIGTGASLSLNGTKTLVALSTALTSNSALTGLGSNAGQFFLEDGALTTTVGLTNSATVEVDNNFNSGGSSLTIGGALTNNSFFQIGNGGLGAATKVTAASLSNGSFSDISVTGGAGAATATLSLTGASSDGGSIGINGGGVIALGNTLAVTGSLVLDGGTVSGGTLAGAGAIETGFSQTGTLSAVTIASGATFTAEPGSTLIDNGVTVSGTLSGSGSATLDFAKTGTDSLTNVSGFTTIGLANGAANNLTLAAANFTGVSGAVTVNDGNAGNTVSGSTLAAADAIVVHAGTGADTLTGGAGNDAFFAGGDTAMTGGGGTNQFVFGAPGAANTIADFAASSTNKLVFSNAGFSLGQSGAGPIPQALSASLFVANATGAFSTTAQRLAYDTANGELFSSTDGSGGTSHLVATLTGEPAINAATQLFFIS